MSTFYHTGKLGDIIYSLPSIQAVGGGKLILNISKEEYEVIKDLLAIQPYISSVELYTPDKNYEYFTDLSRFRINPKLGKIHIVHAHAIVLSIKTTIYPFFSPWLKVIPNLVVEKVIEPFAVISVTDRYRDKFFNWKKEINWLKKKMIMGEIKNIYFMGLEEEYKSSIFQNSSITYLKVDNLSDAAFIISKAKYFSSNQNALLAIRQGLGLSYRMEQSPNHSDCNQYSSRETILNPYSRKLHLLLVTIKDLLLWSLNIITSSY
jgi:hypothetical protein